MSYTISLSEWPSPGNMIRPYFRFQALTKVDRLKQTVACFRVFITGKTFPFSLNVTPSLFWREMGEYVTYKAHLAVHIWTTDSSKP